MYILTKMEHIITSLQQLKLTQSQKKLTGSQQTPCVQRSLLTESQQTPGVPQITYADLVHISLQLYDENLHMKHEIERLQQIAYNEPKIPKWIT